MPEQPEGLTSNESTINELILAIETATDMCSVVFRDEDENVYEKRADAHGSHSEKLFLFIKELMKEHDFRVDQLEAVLVSEGPGSYTGLRIAASGVKGLLFGSDVPLYGVSTLAAMAQAVFIKHPSASIIHAVIDARRVHLYHQSFEAWDDILKASKEVETKPIESFQELIQPGDIIIGTGIVRLDESIIKKVKTLGKEVISARSLIKLYESEGTEPFIHEVNPAEFDPKYYTSNQV